MNKTHKKVTFYKFLINPRVHHTPNWPGHLMHPKIGAACCTLTIGAAGCTLMIGAAGCILTIGAAGRDLVGAGGVLGFSTNPIFGG